jgi:hypothetical protein
MTAIIGSDANSVDSFVHIGQISSIGLNAWPPAPDRSAARAAIPVA